MQIARRFFHAIWLNVNELKNKNSLTHTYARVVVEYIPLLCYL
nr:MAG TPA: hypothetical protein [Caudoviricetes sp.]